MITGNRLTANTQSLSHSLRLPYAKRIFFTCTTILALLLVSIGSAAAAGSSKDHAAKHHAKKIPENVPRHLWVDPVDIGSRDLFYGPGGKDHAPHTVFTFLKEDLKGTNPKFEVRDENGVKWKVKLGPEARPEVVASRLLWAVGYFANEDYFVPELHVENMHPLKRGRKLVGPDGTVHNVRMKRYTNAEGEKLDDWQWHENPFTGTREFNGLRVMMCLINNWDLKDENNSIYKDHSTDPPGLDYTVSDLGSSFGAPGISFPIKSAKGNLPAYSKSKLIHKVRDQYVDFNVPARPSLWRLVNPKEFKQRLGLRWIGKDIPRADARWMGQLLSRLSRDQIREAFQAAGYSPEEIAGFTDVVEKRISELNQL